MTVNIQAVHFTADAKLIDFINAKLEKTTQFFDRINAVDVFLKLDNNHLHENKIVEIHMSMPGHDLVVTKEHKSFEEATDHAVDVLIRQIKKHKQKVQEVHK